MDNEILQRNPPKEQFSNMMHSFKFESANLIEVFEDADEILQFMLNIIKFGGECMINVSVSKKSIPADVSKDKLKRATDLVKIIKLLHGNRKRGGNKKLVLLESLACYPRYNYITNDLLYKDSPAILAFHYDNGKPLSLIKTCVQSKNLDMMFELFKHIEIKEIINSNTFDVCYKEELEQIIMSDRAYDFLDYIGRNKDQLNEMLIVNSFNFHDFSYALDLEKPIKDKGNNENEGEDDIMEPNFTEADSIMYAYYQFNNTHEKVGKEIHRMNTMFFNGSNYKLDLAVPWLTIEQIKRLNEHGFVIGKYFYYVYSHRSIVFEANRKEISTVAKVNAHIRECNEMNLHFQSSRYITSYALKHALIEYRQSNGATEDKVEYFLKLILDRKDEHKLFIPEIVWIMSKYFAMDHKFMKLLLPNDKAMKDFILFQGDIEIIPRVGQSAFENFYSADSRRIIWSDLANLIVEKEFLLNGVLDQCEQFICDEETHGSKSLPSASKTHVSLMKACFELNKDKSVMEKIVRKACLTSNANICMDEYKVDAYVKTSLLRLPMVFIKLAKKGLKAKNAEKDEESKEDKEDE